MQVFKFGGASVKDAEAVRNAGSILARYEGQPVLVVISAMGKMTNAFERLAEAYFRQTDEIAARYAEIKDFHQNIINGLLKCKDDRTFDDIDNLFLELDCLLETDKEPNSSFDYIYDQIVCFGELISTRIVSAYLNENGQRNRWMDCRNFIFTDNNHREARVDWEQTSELISKKLLPIAKKQLIITQGFIGRGQDLTTTTLGRDGSDYSAAIFAYGIDAESVTIWKDVAGVMNADPKRMPDAVMFDSLSFKETIELAYYGANVIHPKTIQPLLKKNIPLYVRSFFEADAPGTLISNEGDDHRKPIFIFKSEQVLISLYTRDFSFIVEEHLSTIFKVFGNLNLRVNLMQNSAISFSVCVNHDPEKTQQIQKILQKDFEVVCNLGVELISVKNYTKESIDRIIGGREVMLEQRSRSMDQFVVK
ncbi:MAG: aspartate kinase [Flavobacteriaceae bacterium]|nr:aspartate kinase [Flavobacteriaceae bacterium]